MVDLIFNDSGAASLALSKKTGDKSSLRHIKMCSDSDGNETLTDILPDTYMGPTVDGDIADIAALWLMGDVGDIAVLPDWRSRRGILQEISDTHEMGNTAWIEQECIRAQALVNRLENAAKSGESIRIWWSDLADETCGFYWAMALLQQATGPITSVKVPRFYPHGDGYSVVNGTGALSPDQFSSLLHLERPIDSEERNALALHWNGLVAENAPLRAVINGIPCSVPENFYDYILYQVFPDTEFKIVEAIGRALKTDPGGVSYWWYMHRIRHMIACGVLEVVHPGTKFHYTTVQFNR
ncbi:MAG: DUF1835 domain-containing protein [Oscillospiraceae bacterium]|nr:DUF1835 domain-containing protein [Oscillospiraceae bacterium]